MTKQRSLEETPYLEAPYDLQRDSGDMREIVAFTDPEDEERTIRIDMTFFLSRYACVFGSCASNRPQMGMRGYGCCTEPVLLNRDNNWPSKERPEDDDDVERIERLLPELDDSIFANRAIALEQGAYTVERGDGPKEFRLRTVNGACIFANPQPETEDDPAPGCAFHLLAQRRGVSHVETKPEVCWAVPLWVEEDVNEREVVSITGMSRSNWGGDENYPDFAKTLKGKLTPRRARSLVDGDYIGYWCVDSPDPYGENNEQAYRYFAEELTRIIGPAAYARLLEIAADYGERRTLMPGERVNGGEPTIATVNSVFDRIRATARG